MKKHSRFLALTAFLAVTVIFGTITMFLWNALVPALFGLPVLSWLQSIGLLVLCRILFGGISGGFGRMAMERDKLFRERWGTMTDEQRNHLAEEIKKRHGCDFWFGRGQDDSSSGKHGENQ
ncbi:hypothetical protein AGMMS50230_13530 [Spirochaetia bacterium]|nr:hypothetical protein AGMMS50230_13530 [Spirochaetia bacterium]